MHNWLTESFKSGNPYIKEVIHSQATKYRNGNKNHKNKLINPLIIDQTTPRRLKRQWPEDLVR
jgi:hypothetical protein